MKYWECLNVPGQFRNVALDDTVLDVDPEDIKPVEEEEPTSGDLTITADENPCELVDKDEDDSSDSNDTEIPDGKVNEFFHHMSELAKQTEMRIPEELESTELDDDQAGEVVGTLMKYQKEYFQHIPLQKTQVKRFIFNVPKKVFDGHIKSEDYMRAPCLDPLFWLYLFCTEDPYDSIGPFIVRAMELIENNPDWYEEIFFSNEEYMETISENEKYAKEDPSDDEEVPSEEDEDTDSNE